MSLILEEYFDTPRRYVSTLTGHVAILDGWKKIENNARKDLMNIVFEGVQYMNNGLEFSCQITGYSLDKFWSEL